VDNGFVITNDDDATVRSVVEIREDGPAEDYQKHQVEALVSLLHSVTDWARMTDGPDILSDHNRYGLSIEITDKES
jgi:hypothetical protein